jgi:hypothetical protein
MIDFVPPEETPAREYPSVRARAQPSRAEPSRVQLPARAVLRSAPAAPMRRRRGTAADDRMALRNTEQQMAPKSIPPRPQAMSPTTSKQTKNLAERLLGTDGGWAANARAGVAESTRESRRRGAGRAASYRLLSRSSSGTHRRPSRAAPPTAPCAADRQLSSCPDHRRIPPPRCGRPRNGRVCAIFTRP